MTKPMPPRAPMKRVCKHCGAEFLTTELLKTTCSRSCVFKASRENRGGKISYLKPGDPLPAGEPRRYIDSRGYVRLRWRVGPSQYVEAWEHRLVTDAPAGLHVHHKNGDKEDNRLENLELLTASEHLALHWDEFLRPDQTRIDVDTAVALYEAGWGTLNIGKYLNADPAGVWRALKKRGVKMRPPFSQKPYEARRRQAAAKRAAS